MKSFYLYGGSIFLILCSLFVFLQTGFAEKNVYIVDTPSLTVRSQPTADAEPIGYLQAGNQIRIFNTENGWAQSYFNSQKGWVASQYLYPSPILRTTVQYQPQKITVDEVGVRIRSGPSTTYPVHSIAANKKQYELISTSNDWQEILLDNGSTGWVASWLTTSAEKTDEKKADALPLNGYTIVLDAGHGGRDPGAIALDNTYEKNLTLATVLKTADLLREKGATVIMTRKEDVKLSLDKRVEISNQSFADAFISIHYNSSLIQTNRGTQTYFFDQDNNQELAAILQESIASHLPLPDAGVKQADFRVLKNNQNPAVLVELGFLSNPDDLSHILEETFQSTAAFAVTEGIINYLHKK